MRVLKCTSCGGRIEVGGNAASCVCKYCGSTVLLSKNGGRDENGDAVDIGDSQISDKTVKRLVIVFVCCFLLTVGLSLLGFVLTVLSRLFLYSLF